MAMKRPVQCMLTRICMTPSYSALPQGNSQNLINLESQCSFHNLEELQEGSKALHHVLEHDLPKMQKEKPATVSHATSSVCDRCGRDLYGSSYDIET